MGSSSSLPSCLSEELLEEYIQLTYLSRSDILKLYKRYSLMVLNENHMNLQQRFPMDLILEVFPDLKFNPFRDRIFRVFSSLEDNCFSFEDMLDLCSVMSENCPDKVKAKWAFEIFDFNEDGLIDSEDIKIVMDRLTQGNDVNRKIDEKDKNYIVEVLLKAMDIQRIGSINRLEFEHAIGKMPEFPGSFSFRI